MTENFADDWHRAAADRPKHFEEHFGIGEILLLRVRGHGLHPLEISTRAKALTFAGEQNRAQTLVLVESFERFCHTSDHLRIESVALFRPVEGNAVHTLVLRD